MGVMTVGALLILTLALRASPGGWVGERARPLAEH